MTRNGKPLQKATRPRTLGSREVSVQARANRALARRISPDLLPFVGHMLRGGRSTDVPQWGGPSRDMALRRLWRQHGAEPIQGATAAIIQKVQSTSWYIEGPRGVAARAHAMLHNADFGAGWEPFLSRVIQDYLLQDNGCFIEILGEGPKDSALRGAALGIAHIDSARCTRTGDPEYPVVYRDFSGGLHKMHWSRVWFTADLPSPQEDRLGVGFCALSRCVASAQAMIHWSQMRNEMIDDFPPSGVLALSGINKEAFEAQMKMYQADREAKEQEVYRGLITLFQPNPAYKMSLELLNFRQLYQNFAERELYDVIIDLVAMAFGIDRQEIAPLSTSALGSGAQSTVLNQKSRGKGVGNLLSLIERFVNRVIPSSVTFRFDFADDEQDMQQAKIRHLKASTILSLYTGYSRASNIQFDAVQASEPSTTARLAEGGLLNRSEARYMLAKEGIIPRELLSDAERLNPDWEQFDDITAKAYRLFGPRVSIGRDGKIYHSVDWQQFRIKGAQGVPWLRALEALPA